MPNQTRRLQMDLPVGADTVDELRLAITDIANTLDSAATVLTGLISALPAPSLAGRRYYATDIGQELYDTGSKWIPVGSAVPVGALSQYAGSVDPVDADGTTRWMICNGRVLVQTSYAALFGIVGSAYNTGGEGGGNFRIPNGQGRFPLGKAASGTGSTLGGTGGSLGHTHSVPGLAVPGLAVPGLGIPGLGIPALQVGSHVHTLSTNGYAQMLVSHTSVFGNPALGIVFLSAGGATSSSSFEYIYVNAGSGNSGNTAGVITSNVPGLGGFTDGSAPTTVGSTTGGGTTGGGTTGGGTTGGGTTGGGDPAYLTVNHIIKVL